MTPAWEPPPPPSKTPLPPVFPFRWACAFGEDEFGLWQAFEVKGVRQMLRWIPPGEFLMGSPETEVERFYDEDRVQVSLTEGFWLADTTCTQALWVAVMGLNPSRFTGDATRPVERVSWREIKGNFLPSLNRLVPELNADLPNDAEWEYACRAGTDTPFWFGEQITPDLVNYNGEHPYANGEKGVNRGRPIPVKSLPPNGWGLYEMHGNVWEWCRDSSNGSPEFTKATVDAEQNLRRQVVKGGSWDYDGRHCRSAYRSTSPPNEISNLTGFRLSRGAA